MRRQRRARRELRRSEWLGQPCTSIYAEQGDKAFEDCEDWCLESKVSHCRYCKCRGCKHCHGDLSLPDWVYNTPAEMQCASFGICLNTTTYPLCLSVWRGEVFDDAPVVWSRCRTDVKRHQQWALPAADAADGSFRVQLRGSDATHGESLCVAAPSAAALSS